MRQWKTLFLRNHPINAKVDLEIDKDSIKGVQEYSEETAPESSIDENTEILDEQDFADYLDGIGDWTFAKDLYVLPLLSSI